MGYKDIAPTTQDFMALATVVGINESIIDTCISLRQQKKVKLPDTIIAATALVHGLTLLTRNTKDFQFVDGLTCLNPHDL